MHSYSLSLSYSLSFSTSLYLSLSLSHTYFHPICRTTPYDISVALWGLLRPHRDIGHNTHTVPERIYRFTVNLYKLATSQDKMGVLCPPVRPSVHLSLSVHVCVPVPVFVCAEFIFSWC